MENFDFKKIENESICFVFVLMTNHQLLPKYGKLEYQEAGQKTFLRSKYHATWILSTFKFGGHKHGLDDSEARSLIVPIWAQHMLVMFA